MPLNYEKFLNSLPVLPDTAAKVLSLADTKDFSFQTLEETVMLDPSLTSKILRIANSAQFARQNEVTQLRTAITLLGLNTIKNLVILLTGSGLFHKSKNSSFYAFFWKHSLLSAFLSRDLAVQAGRKEKADQAFVAGLLHNIGQVAFYLSDPNGYEALLQSALAGRRRISALEEEAFGTDHKRVGHQVLQHWNFPGVYTDAALEHGNNNITSEHKQVIILVSTADFLASNLDFLKDSPHPLALLQPYLPFLGLTLPQLEEFQATCLDRLAKDKLFQECRGIFALE